MPEPESEASWAGPRTATPSARSRAARSKAPGSPFAGAAGAAAGPGAVELGEVLARPGARDGRGDHLAVAVDGRDPVAGGVNDRRVQVAGVGRPDQLAVGHDGGAVGAEGLHDGLRDRPRLVGREDGGREHERRQRHEQGEWGPEMGQPNR